MCFENCVWLRELLNFSDIEKMTDQELKNILTLDIFFYGEPVLKKIRALLEESNLKGLLVEINNTGRYGLGDTYTMGAIRRDENGKYEIIYCYAGFVALFEVTDAGNYISVYPDVGLCDNITCSCLPSKKARKLVKKGKRYGSY